MPAESDAPILPPALIAVGNVRVAAGAVRIQFSRASGPGGQNVNKVNSRAEAWLSVGAIEGMTDAARTRLRAMAGSRLTAADEIHVDAHESRSQEQNRAAAIDRLREMIVRAVVEPKRRRKTKPSRGSKERRLEGKRRRSEVKRGRAGAD
ncbi:MAG TPA: alternative ribosome rescue aminoacyl-tRNA hydrolase ArfB [Tepidisphaeraceae bacterium]|jgi:ribosome-associated protein